ncbi:MAG: hypothetical protein KDE53_13640 [Caldilineaceae bacterium]|nr:hypothetical protein [Caldilineaceae bacterium]
MSQLRQVTTTSSGHIDPSFKLTWADFVQVVLEVTVHAYFEMRTAVAVERGWEENTFTINLAEYLRPLAFDRNLRVIPRPKVHTDAMKSGKQQTIEAKEIDLQLFGTWERDYDKRHFVWEAKRVGDKRLAHSYSNLNSEYVNEAIYRFIQRDYAGELDDAGILGYVLDGKVATIVDDINQSMGRIQKNPALPDSNHLCLAPPLKAFGDIYHSTHIREDSSTIQLHHLFLTFDFFDSIPK